MDQNDCPPPYDSVVQQPRISSLGRNSVPTNLQKYKKVLNTLNTNSTKQNSNSVNFEFHGLHSDESPIEPLISSNIPICITATTTNEISSLIDSGTLASTSSLGRNSSYFERDGEDSTCKEYLEDQIHVKIQKQIKNTQPMSRKDSKLTNGKYETDLIQMNKVSENECALMDMTGLPSYDTALKIQGCSNI